MEYPWVGTWASSRGNLNSSSESESGMLKWLLNAGSEKNNYLFIKNYINFYFYRKQIQWPNSELLQNRPSVSVIIFLNVIIVYLYTYTIYHVSEWVCIYSHMLENALNRYTVQYYIRYIKLYTGYCGWDCISDSRGVHMDTVGNKMGSRL